MTKHHDDDTFTEALRRHEALAVDAWTSGEAEALREHRAAMAERWGRRDEPKRRGPDFRITVGR